jgi:small conductance mechanosensitive channel
VRLLERAGLSELVARAVTKLVAVLVIALVAVLVARAVSRAASRWILALALRAPLVTDSTRARQRAKTVGGVAASAIRVTVWTVAALLIADKLDVNVGPLIAGAGIAGVAIAFGAQSLVKDFVSGFFILLEDQYGVGDVVVVNGITATVEDVNLRITRMRSSDGTLWYVPNGEVRKVGNTGKDWSRAVVDVAVPGTLDLAVATSAISDEAAKFAADPAWAGVVLEAPEVLGVEALGNDAATVRLAVKTAPLQQNRVARELRARVATRLAVEAVRRQQPPASPGQEPAVPA